MSRRQAGSATDVFIGESDVEWNTIDYSTVEDSSPLDPTDTAGGFGQVTVTVPYSPDVRFLGGEKLVLRDGALGEIEGTIRGRSGGTSTAVLVADSRIGQLAVERTLPPMVGTLGEVLLAYMASCGLTERIIIDEDLASIPVSLPGWKANVFDQINKKMAPAFGFEMSLVSNMIVIRKPRQNEAVTYRNMQESWAFDEQNLAQSVEGRYYETRWARDLAYPPGGWSDEVTVYTVDAGQTIEADLEIDASLISVEQPTPVSFVDRSHASSSVYSVSGNDGLIIPPAQWLADGGSVRVEIGEDTRSLKVVITGARNDRYAPYSISMASGTSDTYSSLRIVGTGVFMSEGTLTLPASLNPDLAPDEVGAVVENEFFGSRDQLFHAMLRSVARYSTPRQTINITTRGINRVGETGSAIYPTIGDIKALYPGATIGDLKTELGPLIRDWNEKLFDLVTNDFDNQAFGNVAGARVLHEDSWYRIRNATIAPGKVTYQAERDNTLGDVYHHGETIGEWNARWAGKTIKHINAAPLAGLPLD